MTVVSLEKTGSEYDFTRRWVAHNCCYNTEGSNRILIHVSLYFIFCSFLETTGSYTIRETASKTSVSLSLWRTKHLGFSRRCSRPSKVALQLPSSSRVMAIRNGKVNLLGFVLPAGSLEGTMHDGNSGFTVWERFLKQQHPFALW